MSGHKKVEYEVDSKGCWNCISHAPNKDGYPSKWYKGMSINMHRNIYLTQVGDIPEGLVVRHKCDNRLCINPEHLELGTPADNTHDMMERGRGKPTFGADNPRAKLTEKDVKEIIKKYKGGEKQVTLANEYRVTKGTICKIVHKKHWEHLQTEAVC
jgi:hypothetical protein